MFKQLEELQRQKKLQELNNSVQQSDIYQQSLIQNKQAPGVQYGPLINGTPVRDPSCMFMFGNPNLVQGFQNGLPYSPAQNQVPHSIDGNSFSRFSKFQGVTHESTGEQFDTASRSYTSDQLNVPYQEGNMFGPSSSQGLDMGGQTGNDSQGSTSLDPLEQKFLFDTDGDSVGGFGKMFEDDDDKGVSIPSLQSGSWSALMQSALDETSSTDTGVQEEWSGLSFQNPELSSDNHPSNLMENANNPTLWQNNVFQNAPSLTSTPDHLKTFNARSSFPGFEQSHEGTSESEASAHVQRLCQVPNEHAGAFDKICLPSKESEVTTFISSDCSGMSAVLDRSADLSSMDSNTQTSRRHETQSAYIGTVPVTKIPRTKTADIFTPSSNSCTSRAFDSRLAPSTQRSPVNHFDLSRISQQAATSHLVSLKNQDGLRLSPTEGHQVPKLTSGANVWVDIHSDQQVSILNSQGLDYTKGLEESFSGRAESNISSLNQAYISPLNPAYSNPNIRAIPKSERVESDTKISEPNSVYENYRSLLVPSTAKDDQLVKISSQSPVHRNNSFVQMNLASTSQDATVKPVIGSNSSAVNQLSPPYLQHLNVANQDLVVSQSKKRKFSTYNLLPWHKETAQGSLRLQDMSIAELEWAQTANRVPEKLKGETEALGNLHWLVHPKKKIIFTTQLMQVLFPPVPALILSADATACYNTVTYYAARLAVGDACSLAIHSHKPCNMSDSLPGENVILKGIGNQNISKIVENLIDQAKKLEDELLRLESRTSFMEIRMKSQDLEKFAAINRFAKFYSWAQMAAAESACSGGASTVSNLCPQRYVTASQMPKIVPDGRNCISL
ncbi:uncharacterized protein [Rutidosis leptorrhynchoides]|uniref:uncharacterized protein n=1 Tax=Rutidosis leptorrhynchoides TaxID=125765 RepID=UPI003A997BAB